MTEIALRLYIRERPRRRRKRARKVCTRVWILRRKQFGLYDHLMVELRNEDQTEFCNFMRMPPEMFDEIRHIISKKRTWYRQFGGHKNRENKSLKIEFKFLLVYYGLICVFIHIRLTIQRNRIFALLDKKLFIYLMQNFRYFTYLMLRGA